MKPWTVRFIWRHGTRFRIFRVKIGARPAGYYWIRCSVTGKSSRYWAFGTSGVARFNVSVDGGPLLYCTKDWRNVKRFCETKALEVLRGIHTTRKDEQPKGVVAENKTEAVVVFENS